MPDPNVSDSQLLSAMGTVPDNVSDAELLQQMGGSQEPSPASAPAAPSPQKPGFLQSASAGVLQGARDLVSTVAPLNIALTHFLGGGDAAGEHAALNHLSTARSQFNQQYGDNIPAQGGRILSQVAGTLPVLAASGEMLEPAAAALRTAIPAAAPAVDFMAGTLPKGTNKLIGLASRGTNAALQGGTAALTTSGQSDQPVGQQVAHGAELGGFLGSAAPAAYDLFGGAYNKLTGGGVSQPVADLADAAVNKFGIPIRGSQISQSPFVKYLDSTVGKMPFSGMETQNEAQRAAFSRAVAGTFGERSDNLTPQVMSNARARIGNVFNQVAANTNITGSPLALLDTSLGKIVNDASQTLPQGSVTPIEKQAQAIRDIIANGAGIDGDTYQALTRKGTPLDRAMNGSDPNIRFYAGQIRSALDDALQQSAAPGDLAKLQQARLQWKNMRTVQELAAKAGIEGEISPAGLLGAVKKSYKDMPYSGAGDIGQLAQIGQQFLKEPPSSGTGERMALYSMLGLGGETAGNMLHDPNAILHTATAGAGLLGAGRLIGSGLKSRAYRDMLLNSAHGGQNTLSALLARPGAQQVINNYAVPSGVIAGNQLFQPSPAPASP